MCMRTGCVCVCVIAKLRDAVTLRRIEKSSMERKGIMCVYVVDRIVCACVCVVD